MHMRVIQHSAKDMANRIKEKKKIDLKSMRDKDRTMVRGKFINHESPGAPVSFPFRKYEDDPVEQYDLMDGGVYTIPYGVAHHLNNNCWYPVYAWVQGSEGKIQNMPENRMEQKVTKKVRRYSFSSLEFMDPEFDMAPTPDLVTVENVVR